MIGYILVVLAVFGRALIPPDGFMIFGDDIHRQYYFFREFFNYWIHQGIFPWWNPYLFGGEPFIANPVVNIWYPPNWLFILLPLNVAYSWHIAFHIFWAMLGMQKLTKSWISGVIFGLSGFFMARSFAGHVDVIAAASWMPWVVYAFTQKNIVLAAGVFAMQLLSGYQTMAFMTVIAVCITTLARRISIKKAVLAGMGGVGLAAFHLVPVNEFFRQSIRTFSFPYSWHAYGALEWRSFIQFLNPYQFGNQYTYNGPPPNFIEHSMFVGIGGLTMAIMGIMRPRGFVFALLAFFGLWVSLGPHAPIDLQYMLWQAIPFYHYLRIPPRHLILVVFGLAGLAATGFSLIKHKIAQAIIGGVLVLEMIVFAKNFIELKAVPENRHDRELISILKTDTQPYRLLQNFGVWLPPRDSLDFDSVMSYRIFSATGYDPSILRSYYEFVAEAGGSTGGQAVLHTDVQVPYLTPFAADQLDFLNIKYILVPRENDPFSASSRYRLLREKEYRLYENTTVRPRFYLEDPCGSVSIRSYNPNRIELEVDSSCQTKLLSSEIHYPGWVAFIDEKKAYIDESSAPFRTLFVSSGKHTITYQYRPIIFVIGLVISVVTLGVLLLTNI